MNFQIFQKGKIINIFALLLNYLKSYHLSSILHTYTQFFIRVSKCSIEINNILEMNRILITETIYIQQLRIINIYLQDMNQVQDTKLNLYKLKNLIDSGIASIPVDKKHQNSVLVIGDTGVGKTTILSFLAKRKLYIKIHGLNTILDSQDQDGLKIGHDRFSETRVPSKIIIDNMVFFDCSGFKDNRGQQYEISNSFFVQRLFNIYANIKILLIIDESSISEVRADKLPKLIRNLLKSFNQLSDIQDGVILLINKAKPQFSQKKYSQEVLKIAKLKTEDGFLLNEEERNFLEFLVKNKKVCLFKQAQKQDQGKVLDIKEENLLNLIRDTNFVKSKKIKNIISQSAKLSIREYIDHLADEAEPKIQKLCQQIIKDFSYRSHNNFTDSIQAAQQTKKKVVQFSRNIQNADDSQIIEVLRDGVAADISSFEKDVGSVLFFKNIYNKSDYYFKLIRSSLASTLSKLLLQVDEDIAKLQKQQKALKELEERAAQSAKKQEQLRKQLEAFKTKEQQYKTKIAENNKTHTQKINQLELSSEQKGKQLANLTQQLQKFNEQFTKLKANATQKQQKQSQLQKTLESKDKQIEQLTNLLNSLKLQSQSHHEEIEMLNEQNNALKKELDEAIIQIEKSEKKSQLNDSKISKSSKYPDVVCPHFKNGGKCVHCIKKWKDEQKKIKKEEQNL